METTRTFDKVKAITAQKALCAEKGWPLFAPADGVCFRCKKQIYDPVEKPGFSRDGEEFKMITVGISVEKASTELVTGCPHCNYSYCE
jgi:hypothetical protein